MTNIVLPIKQKDVYGGLAEITGLIRKDSDTLVIEYQVKDDVLGMFNSDVKILELPFNYIHSIEVEKKWFVCDFEIYLNRLPSIQKPLVIRENCLSFRINKKDIEKARNIRTSLMIAISEKHLSDMDNLDSESMNEQSEAYTKSNSSEKRTRDSGDNDGLQNILRDS
jgi:hypothetical protein